jgi:hypothetical protein
VSSLAINQPGSGLGFSAGRLVAHGLGTLLGSVARDGYKYQFIVAGVDSDFIVPGKNTTFIVPAVATDLEEN